MQFWKLNIVLVVLVFSLDNIKSSPQDYDPVADADEGVNDTDQGVDDSDEGVNDADEGVNDADQGVDDADEGVNDTDEDDNNSVADTTAEVGTCQENEEFDSCRFGSCPDDCYNYKEKHRVCTTACFPGCICKKGYVRHPKDNTCIKPEQCPKYPISDQCKPGEYFYMKDCNICYCYAEGTQGCTNIVCKKETKITLLGKPKQTEAYKKLRDTATACVPGEKFTSNGCNCNCVIPSVMTCDKSCVG